MEERRVRVIENITDIMQRVGHAWKFDPEAWLNLDLTIVQLKSLFFIDFEGNTNFKNLAVALGVTPPSVTSIVDRLVDQGLVSREENPENRRMQVLKTTDKGKALLAKLTESRRSRISSLLSNLSLQDLASLARILAAMSETIEHSQGSPREEISTTKGITD
jgi:DNA-binding MarR family transcriptional regulator